MILNKDQQKGLYQKFGGEGGFGRTQQSRLFSAINSGSGFTAGGTVEKITESVKPKQKFATGGIAGGIIGGNSTSGDKIIARVNSGEMILNQKQQSVLYKSMGGQGNFGSSAQTRLFNTISASKGFAKGGIVANMPAFVSGGIAQPQKVDRAMQGREEIDIGVQDIVIRGSDIHYILGRIDKKSKYTS
ncbi:hypothetical protein Barb4_02071 [Bacteroidales bacterium Barb4]|nr:hypothetical protein Barb4_02071 [Bacteroidales bacterium Barb4]